MERVEIENIVLNLVAMAYGKDRSAVTTESRIKEDLGGTSVMLVGLVSEIENELDVLVQLPVAAACKTVGELVDKVEELM